MTVYSLFMRRCADGYSVALTSNGFEFANEKWQEAQGGLAQSFVGLLEYRAGWGVARSL